MSADETTLEMMRQLVAAQPTNWEARGHLAELLLASGRTTEALELVDEAPPPDGVKAGLLVGRVLAAAAPERAIQHYRGLVEADRRCAPAHLALAWLYRERGLREDARHHYGIAVVIDEALEDEDFDAWIHGGAAPEPARKEPVSLVEPEDEEAGGDAPSPTAEELEEVIDLDATAGPRLPRIDFSDVGGMDELKERVRMHVIYPFRNPELFKKFKKRPGGGILLYGPPGCGKTYMARATAGECGAHFISVGVTDVLSRWLGQSEERIAEIFATARRRAPTVIFIDELDALGMSRRDARGSSMTTTINQLLAEMDGIHANNENLMVLAATNAPWAVDAAFRRPGRFDRVVLVPPPDVEARQSILELHLRDIPHEEPDYAKLIKLTKRFSGADLMAVVERASEMAIMQEMKSGKPSTVTRKMLLLAAKGLKPSTVEWLDTAKNYASYANRSGQYDDIAQFFERDVN